MDTPREAGTPKPAEIDQSPTPVMALAHKVKPEAPPQEVSVGGASTQDRQPVIDAPSSRRGRWSLRRPFLAVLSVLVAGLVFPAATKQWSDRTQELAFKKDILTQMAQASTADVVSSTCIVQSSSCEPEAAALSISPDSQELRQQAYVAGQRAIDETLSTWTISSSSTYALLKEYFPNTPLPDNWKSYADAVKAFTRLGTARCGAAREYDMSVLRAQLPQAMDEWSNDLLRDIGPTCQATPSTFVAAYAAIGDELLAEQQNIADQVLNAHSIGFSSGIKDFVRDLWPL